MRVLVIEHDAGSGAWIVGERLEQHGFVLEPFRVVHDNENPVSHEPFPDPRRFDLVVPMGSPWSVYDVATIGSWIGRELDLLVTAVEADIPVLGVCFGGQALSAALGGTVERSPRAEIGWSSIDTDEPDLVAAGPWMQWHYDRFTAPPGAKEIARNDVGPQAYVIGRSMGLQFHPEATPEQLQIWYDLDDPTSELEPLGLDAAELMADTRVRSVAARPRTYRLVDAFLRDVAGLL